MLVLVFGVNCLGEVPPPPRRLNKTDSLQIEAEVDAKARKLRDALIKQGEFDYAYSEWLGVEFTVDTFRIKESQRLQLDIDYSTSGMTMSAMYVEEEYDKLLNKYYHLLLRSLSDEDKEILRRSQRNWMSFRDSERKLNSILLKPYYSGYGTIHKVFASARDAEITRSRVIELYDYLMRKVEFNL